MLVLTREMDERIMIGADIVITVVEIRGERVKLGIDAPREVRVDREEIRLRIDQHNSRNRTRNWDEDGAG